jgi:hypothetical protein
VPATHGPLAMRVEFLRNHNVQLIFRASHRDIKQPPFFFDFLCGADAEVRRDATIHGIEDIRSLWHVCLPSPTIATPRRELRG